MSEKIENEIRSGSDERGREFRSVLIGKTEVTIFPKENYGAFENIETGSGGGLWFEKPKRLIDYDGTYSLPNNAIKGIRKLGYTVPREFENKA